MAMSKASLKQKLETELQAQGFVLAGEFGHGREDGRSDRQRCL